MKFPDRPTFRQALARAYKDFAFWAMSVWFFGVMALIWYTVPHNNVDIGFIAKIAVAFLVVAYLTTAWAVQSRTTPMEEEYLARRQYEKLKERFGE